MKRRMTYVVTALIAAGLLAGCGGNNGTAATKLGLIQTNDTYTIKMQTKVPNAQGHMIRLADQVIARIHGENLPPGVAVTCWLVPFNMPESCKGQDMAVDGSKINRCNATDLAGAEGSINYAGAGFVDSSGKFSCQSTIMAMDPANSQTGMGLIDPMHADIHMSIRNHGTPLTTTASLAKQLGAFNGGCTGACPNVEFSFFELGPTVNASLPMTVVTSSDFLARGYDAKIVGFTDHNTITSSIGGDATAKLVRTDTTIDAAFHLRGQTNGHVISLVAWVFNSGGSCKNGTSGFARCGQMDLMDTNVNGTQLFVQSAIVGFHSSHTANFSVHLDKGMNGLTDTNADIQLVAYDQGPLDASKAMDQFSKSSGSPIAIAVFEKAN